MLPTYLLSKAAREEVTVVLTGEGSDETNAGYRTYLRHAAFAKHETWLRALQPLWPLLKRVPGVGGRLTGLMSFAKARGESGRWLLTQGHDTEILSTPALTAIDDTEAKLTALLDLCASRDPIERMQHLDRWTWMSECTLMKADRMTMAASLEARVPFLDHPLAELAARISPALRLEGGETKSVVRRILAKRYAPASMRPQSGFVLPLASWFRDGEFHRWVSDLLSPENLVRRGALDPAAARRVVEHYLATGENTNLIWRMVCLELWFRSFFD